MKNESKQQAYRNENRGDRLHPSLFHSRHRVLVALRQELQRIANSELLSGNTVVIDYGCGNRPYERIFRPKFRSYWGVDLSGNPMADLAIDTQSQLPLRDESVDCVLSFQVLEHLESPQAYLAEARRTLKANGALVLSTHGMWQYHPDPVDYWRWTIEGLQLEVRRAGFQVLSIRSVMGKTSFALQLLQDATARFIPRFARSLYYAFFQMCIGIVEWFRHGGKTEDACVYVILAQKNSNVKQRENPNRL